jgi:Holliday junction resolvase RusA-like endonuclease
VSVLQFTAVGEPAPQGSKRIGRNRAGRPIILDDNDAKKTTWRETIHHAALFAMREDRYTADLAFVPVAVTVVFYFERRSGDYGTGRNAGVVKEKAPNLKTSKPDVDKLARAVLDSLTTAGVVVDDAQVAQLTVRKQYAPRGSGAPAGALITVETACRMCGCTELDGCVGALGETCHWTRPGVCSSCDS